MVTLSILIRIYKIGIDNLIGNLVSTLIFFTQHIHSINFQTTSAVSHRYIEPISSRLSKTLKNTVDRSSVLFVKNCRRIVEISVFFSVLKLDFDKQ